MNNLLNITINNEPKDGLQNVHINEVHNIPDYSVDLLTFSEINALKYSSCEPALSLILNKVRPEKGVCILEIADVNSICSLYINKIMDSAKMSEIVSPMQNVFGVADIKNLIDKTNNMFSIIKIDKQIDGKKIAITVQRNSA